VSAPPLAIRSSRGLPGAARRREVLWDNGLELDRDEMPVRLRVLLRHLVAQGLVTEPDAKGYRRLTPKGEEAAQKEMLARLEAGPQH
jgi:hypothetical protein